MNYTCGNCGRPVRIYQARQGRLSISSAYVGARSMAMSCSACDTFSCLACGLERRGEGENIVCGICGGPAKFVDAFNHPSWYPGGRQPKHLTRKGDSRSTGTPGRFRGNLYHYQAVLRAAGRTAEIRNILSETAPQDVTAALLDQGPKIWRNGLANIPKEPLSLEGADLSGAVFPLCGDRFVGANFRSANLENTLWWITTLTKADFTGSSLRNSTFLHCQMDGAILQGADQTGAKIEGRL